MHVSRFRRRAMLPMTEMSWILMAMGGLYCWLSIWLRLGLDYLLSIFSACLRMVVQQLASVWGLLMWNVFIRVEARLQLMLLVLRRGRNPFD